MFENKPRPPDGHVFLTYHEGAILVEGRQSNIPVKLHWTQSNGFLQEDF